MQRNWFRIYRAHNLLEPVLQRVFNALDAQMSNVQLLQTQKALCPCCNSRLKLQGEQGNSLIFIDCLAAFPGI